MSHTLDTIDLADGWTVEIISDDDPGNPRKEWDNVGTMVCWHNNYTLGDGQIARNGHWEHMASLLDPDVLEAIERRLERAEERGIYDPTKNMVDYEKAIADAFERTHILLPCYLYDHGGITMSCSSFSDQWDSGMVGFIYCTKAKAVEEWGRANCTANVIEKAKNYLKGEVTVYDQYLTGDVWGYQVKDPDGEDQDSCWGFYGDEYAKEEGRAAGEVCIEAARHKRQDRLKTLIRARVPLQVRQEELSA